MPGSDKPTRRRRRRPARSCEQCRRRKIRCDQELPCSACILARASLQCSYRDCSPLEVSTAVPKPVVLAPADTRSRTASIDVVPRGSGPRLESLGAYPRGPPSIPEPQPARPRDNQPTGSSEPVNNPSLTSRPSFSSRFSSLPPPVPRLRNVPEKTKIFGQTHWQHTAEKVSKPTTLSLSSIFLY